MTAATPPTVGLDRANSALAAARRYRAQWLLSLAYGATSTLELLRHAATVPGRPLTRLTLRQVLGAVPGVGMTTVRRQLQQLLAECGTGSELPNRVTVGWLLDTRSRGRRLVAWLATVEIDTHQPAAWPGYPYTGAPTEVDLGWKSK